MVEVEFGSKEWFEELNSMIKFPEKFTFTTIKETISFK